MALSFSLAFNALSMSSFSGSCVFLLDPRLPRKISDQIMTPWSAIPPVWKNYAFGSLFAQVQISTSHHCCRRCKVFEMAACRKISGDTDGAYRPIDDETDETFSVWGSEDGDFSIPKGAVPCLPQDGQGQEGRSLMEQYLRNDSGSSGNSIKSSTNYARFDEAPDFTAKENSRMPEDEDLKGFSALNVSPQIENSRHNFRKTASSMQSIDAVRKKHYKEFADDSTFFSRKSFKDIGCSDSMIESLEKQSFYRPSNIQAMAYRPVSLGKSCIIADQSGSGKTLAYLAPMVQRLRDEELSNLCKSLPRSPRIVILTPTAELASQVLRNCRLMAKSGLPFRSVVITGGFRQKTQLEALQQELDVLIATPGRFMFLLQDGIIQLTNLKCVVLDEVDILFGDEDFESLLESFIRSAPMTVQYLFATATLPVNIYHKLIEMFPDCKVVMGPGMHRTSSRLEEVVVDCSGAEGEEKNSETAFSNKKTALLQLVERSPVPKTIVFCNKIETCRKVENALKRFDKGGVFRLMIFPFHAALARDFRVSNMEDFLKSESNESMFLVCTDRASRGIDYTNVDHVILFDFPRDPSEYVRRVGRTARGAAGHGKAFVFVVGRQVSFANRIIERNRKGHPLHDVPNAYELQSSVL